MKKTKSMVYKPTAEARELYVYSDNNGALYESLLRPFIDRLYAFYERGTYDNEKAVALLYRYMCAASEQYRRDFGYSFNVQDRYTAAVDMEADIVDMFNSGNWK